MKGILLFLAILVVWLVLAGFVLPRLGIKTCISGSCKIKSRSGKEGGEDKSEKNSIS